MSFDLTNKNISDTFQNLLQKTGSEGHLYDLVGNQVQNLTIGGTLTANSYVVSESVTVATSGSNIFGNSLDDTHQFTGSLHIQGHKIKLGNNYFSSSVNYLHTFTDRLYITGLSGNPGIFNGTDGNSIVWASNNVLNFYQGGDAMLSIDGDNNISSFGVSGDAFKFRVHSEDGTSAPALYVDGASPAKVGIGTAAPTKTLQVTGDISASGTYYVEDSKQIIFGEADDNYYLRSHGGYFKIAKASNELVYISGSAQALGEARVGIGGNPNPPKTLTVKGDISASGDLYLDGEIKGATTTFEGDIRVDGNDIKDSGGNTVLSFDGSGHLNPKTTNGTILNLEGTTVYSNPMMELKMTGLDPQSPWIKFWGSLSPGFAVGMDDGSSPTTFKIIPGVSITDNDGIVLDVNGKVGINTNPVTGIELTVAGDISASGDINLSGHNMLATTTTLGQTKGLVGFDSDLNEVIVSRTTVPITLSSNVTASGNISASGQVAANNYKIGQRGVIGILNNAVDFASDSNITTIAVGKSNDSTPISLYGNITASGDISASGDMFMEVAKGIRWNEGNSNEIRLQGRGGHFRFQSGSMTEPEKTHTLMEISQSQGSTFVGIGTQTPPKTLTVAGDISASGDVYISQGKYIYLDSPTTDDNKILYNSTYGITIDSDEGIRLMHGGGSGGVSINTFTSAPDMELTVEGDISASGNVYGNRLYVQDIGIQKTNGGFNFGTHLTTSHITASGNISASGNIIGELTGIDGAVTGITSIYNTSLKIGADNQTQIDFGTTDNDIIFKVDNNTAAVMDVDKFRPASDLNYSLGSKAVKWKELVVQHITASGNISSSGEIFATSASIGSSTTKWNDGYHGNDEFISILPVDFYSSTTGRPGEISTDGAKAHPSHTTALPVAQKTIPKGFTATHVDIYGSNAEDFDVYKGEIDNTTAPQVDGGSCVISTPSAPYTCTLTEPVSGSDGTQYLTIHIAGADATDDYIYGGKITIKRMT